MKLRRRLVIYLGAAHALFAVVAVVYRHPSRLGWVFAEVALIASFLVGLSLVRRLLGRLALVGQGAEFLREGDLTTRLRGMGEPEIDALVDVYNTMAERLRDEGVRLEEQNQFLGQLLTVAPSGVVILDPDGRVAFLNPAARAWLTPAPAATVIGQPLAALETPVGRALAGLGEQKGTVVSLAGGNRVRCQRGTFMDRGANRQFFLLEELTEELRQAEKAAYEKLIRMMAHEVNNSVGAASSLLQSCRTYAPHLPEEHREDFTMALDVVSKRTLQLGALMRGFAEVVRLPNPQLAPCDLLALLREIAVLMRPACEARRVTWRWAIDHEPPLVALDRTQLEQVFVNLIKNALEAIGEDGVITIRVGRRAGRPTVAVEDSGPGLSPEARQQLFTPFFTTKEKGQGIGLTLIQQILTQHQFTYTFEAPPGGPTQFTIAF